jgi:hypothetical protein
MQSLGCNGEASNHSLHACMRRSSLVASRMQRDHTSRTAGGYKRAKSWEPVSRYNYTTAAPRIAYRITTDSQPSP